MPICEQCGNECEDMKAGQRFCTTRCSERWWLRNQRRKHGVTEIMQKVCPNCEETFSTWRVAKIYCNEWCCHNYQSKRQAERKRNARIQLKRQKKSA